MKTNQQVAAHHATTDSPGTTEPIDSPPPAHTPEALDVSLHEARQRLFQLRTLLTNRFDSKHWDEYLHLRRTQHPSSV